MALTLLMRCASMALAVSFASSALHKLASRMRSSGIQWAYTHLSFSRACHGLTGEGEGEGGGRVARRMRATMTGVVKHSRA
jgi:hypothetical protein